MEASLKFAYDRDADILHIDKVKLNAQKEAEGTKTIEVLFFSTRLLPGESVFELPVISRIKKAV